MASVSWRVLSTFVNDPAGGVGRDPPARPGRPPTSCDRRGDAVSLNPQPLPPHRGGASGAAAAREPCSVSADHHRRRPGRRSRRARSLRAEIEDWCGTGWPRQWPKPKPPKGWDDSQVFAGAALAAADLGRRSTTTPRSCRTPLGAAAEQLAEAAAATSRHEATAPEAGRHRGVPTEQTPSSGSAPGLPSNDGPGRRA